MESRPSSATTTPLAARVGKDADATRVADSVGVLWHEIDEVLSPIIGNRGLAALYQRALHVSTAAYPWLSAALDGVKPVIDTAALGSLLATRTSAEAAACGNHLLQQFHGLLETLLGASLTGRLLEPVWGPPQPERAAKDVYK
jgi:hypothetical protein